MPSTFMRFPAEILTLVYIHCSDFSDIASLSRTCRAMHAFWQHNEDWVFDQFVEQRYLTMRKLLQVEKSPPVDESGMKDKQVVIMPMY